MTDISNRAKVSVETVKMGVKIVNGGVSAVKTFFNGPPRKAYGEFAAFISSTANSLSREYLMKVLKLVAKTQHIYSRR